jgi:hypothetical protein
VIGKECKIYDMKADNENSIHHSLYWTGLLGFLLPVLSALAFNIFFLSLLPFLWVYGIGLLGAFPFLCLWIGISLMGAGWLLHKLRSYNLKLFAFGCGLVSGGIVGIYLLTFSIFATA